MNVRCPKLEDTEGAPDVHYLSFLVIGRSNKSLLTL
jgi:hypothetical protein